MPDTHLIGFHPSHDNASGVADPSNQRDQGSDLSGGRFFEHPSQNIQKSGQSVDKRNDRQDRRTVHRLPLLFTIIV
jgi:hypothetical protein